jgi:hypothetical protein
MRIGNKIMKLRLIKNKIPHRLTKGFNSIKEDRTNTKVMHNFLQEQLILVRVVKDNINKLKIAQWVQENCQIQASK